jgi:hypothetical protein
LPGCSPVSIYLQKLRAEGSSVPVAPKGDDIAKQSR